MRHSFAVVGNTCHAYLGSTRLYETATPAFLYDADTKTVLRHGPIEALTEMHAGLQASYAKCELDPNAIKLISFDAANANAGMLCAFVDQRYALAAWEQGMDPLNFDPEKVVKH